MRRKLSDLKMMIVNAEEFEEGTKISNMKKSVKDVDYTFDDIKQTLKNFLNRYNRNYRLSFNFPEMQRISEQQGGHKVADFTPNGVKYYKHNVRQQVIEFYKNTKYIEYFEGKVNLSKNG